MPSAGGRTTSIARTSPCSVAISSGVKACTSVEAIARVVATFFCSFGRGKGFFLLRVASTLAAVTELATIYVLLVKSSDELW